MKAPLILAIGLAPWTYCAGQESNIIQRPLTPTGLVIEEQAADVEQLLAQADPAVQQQIARIYAAYFRTSASPHFSSNVEAFKETQTLKELTDDKEKLVKQLAIFAATIESDENMHVFLTLAILQRLHVSPVATIRVLAPYLDSGNDRLQDFADEWFRAHDNAGLAWSPLKPVNYDDYQEYISWKFNRNEEIPAAFVKFIYERSPGRALLVFRSATADVSDYIQLLNEARERFQEGRAPTRQEREEIHQFQADSQRERQERREIVLAEHIISNAIWLKKNKFDERFQGALPEANAELKKLAEHGEWWARLYVVYIMRQHPELRQADIIDQLSADSNLLVREAANSTEE
jgi:hypothetical protein